MASGPGYFDPEGVWRYGEDDSETLMSDLLNLGMQSVSDQLAADRARLTALETDTGWVTPTLAAGWTTQGAQPIQYRRIRGEVICRGRANGIATADPLFTFPVGFRPASGEEVAFLVNSGMSVGTPARVVLRPNGTVNATGNTAPNFIQIRFQTA